MIGTASMFLNFGGRKSAKRAQWRGTILQTDRTVAIPTQKHRSQKERFPKFHTTIPETARRRACHSGPPHEARDGTEGSKGTCKALWPLAMFARGGWGGGCAAQAGGRLQDPPPALLLCRVLFGDVREGAQDGGVHGVGPQHHAPVGGGHPPRGPRPQVGRRHAQGPPVGDRAGRRAS